ncbi:MAG: hypothetical protein K0S08_1302 [Gammaproteobacteria bacterium]|jgi:hypothetical protein|nr:hypothetical protein [Gammaproteobacteria bacterium]
MKFGNCDIDLYWTSLASFAGAGVGIVSTLLYLSYATTEEAAKWAAVSIPTGALAGATVANLVRNMDKCSLFKRCSRASVADNEQQPLLHSNQESVSVVVNTHTP